MDNLLGEIRAFASVYVPTGWALCDGSLLPVQAHQALFTLIGTTYGGDGIHTFAVPDLRGRLLVHRGDLSRTSHYPFATPGGEETVTLAESHTPPHRHTFTVGGEAATTNQPKGNFLAGPVDTGNPDGSVLAYLPYNEADHSLTTVPLGTAAVSPAGQVNPQPHENRQPYLPINYIIALQGIYPTWAE